MEKWAAAAVKKKLGHGWCDQNATATAVSEFKQVVESDWTDPGQLTVQSA
jgi:hypothetical protein